MVKWRVKERNVKGKGTRKEYQCQYRRWLIWWDAYDVLLFLWTPRAAFSKRVDAENWIKARVEWERKDPSWRPW